MVFTVFTGKSGEFTEQIPAHPALRSMLAMVDALEQNVWHEAQQFDVQPDLGDLGAEMRRHNAPILLDVSTTHSRKKNSGIIILR